MLLFSVICLSNVFTSKYNSIITVNLIFLVVAIFILIIMIGDFVDNIGVIKRNCSDENKVRTADNWMCGIKGHQCNECNPGIIKRVITCQ